MHTSLRCSALFLLLIATAATAETIDGQSSGVYGPPRALQATETSLGDNTLVDGRHANGSELDQAVAFVEGDSLHLFFHGNLQDNGSVFELFFDVLPGGQNTLLGNNPNVDGGGLNGMAGLTFDSGFDPDFHFAMSCADVAERQIDLSGYWAELATIGGGEGVFLGTTDAGGYAAPPNAKRIEFTLRNSGTTGVEAGCAPTSYNGFGPGSGIEIRVPLTSIGSPEGCIRICAFINRPGRSSIGNQVLGSLPPGSCDLGEPSLVNFAAIAGDQFFSFCPGSTPVRRATWGELKTLYR